MSLAPVGKDNSLVEDLLSLPRNVKRGILLLGDAAMIPAALFTAVVLRTGVFTHPVGPEPYVVVLITTIAVFTQLGLYRTVLRYMGARAIGAILCGITASAAALLVYEHVAGVTTVPYAALVIYWALALIYVVGSRSLVRLWFSMQGTNTTGAKRVAIYGAGEAGVRLARVLQGGGDFTPVAFVDDKRSLQGNHVNGITVYSASLLKQLMLDRKIDRVLLAMPTASRRRRKEILTALEPLGLRVQSMPELSDIISGNARIDELRDVDVNDLLGRDPVPPNQDLFKSCIEDKSVMVTGAGGSIGSELCRQILTCKPRRLVLFEMSELALYTIDNELRQIARRENLSVEILPLLGNAHHRNRVREVMASCGIQTVYHAAAYKHVPIVEHNVIEGLHNNIISTWYAAEAALETRVETFVLVSTDKAVNPANVMGATKRFAELVLQGLQARTSHTRFCIVRFGNVLGSSGSVVPLFREQIRKGGPVTVTHPEVIRYFMTIPEAAQLVIQAGAMGKGGEVFVLDMGQPVKIADLARRMINLMGLTVRDESNPEGDIDIKFTGLRTAEKLYEELLIGTNVTGTDHPRIMCAIEHSLPWERMRAMLDDLLVALANLDCRRALARLSEAVAEYKPNHDIPDYVWARKNIPSSYPDVVALRTDSKVTVMPKRRASDFGRGHLDS